MAMMFDPDGMKKSSELLAAQADLHHEPPEIPSLFDRIFERFWVSCVIQPVATSAFIAVIAAFITDSALAFGGAFLLVISFTRSETAKKMKSVFNEENEKLGGNKRLNIGAEEIDKYLYQRFGLPIGLQKGKKKNGK